MTREYQDLTASNLASILERVQVAYQAACLVLFGSAARRELCPGSDLDVIAITAWESPVKFEPIVVDGVGVDLNLMSPRELRRLLEEDWYWRGILWNTQVWGRNTEVEDLLRWSKSRAKDLNVMREMAGGWTELAVAFWRQRERAGEEWIAGAVSWHCLVSLVNGILQLMGLQPHAYHKHLGQVKAQLGRRTEVELYGSVISAGDVDYEHALDWLTARITDIDKNERILSKVRACRRRVAWLLSDGLQLDANVYLKHALWVLLMFVACEVLNRPVPPGRSDYTALVGEIADDVPIEIKDFLAAGLPSRERLSELCWYFSAELWSCVCQQAKFNG